VKREVTYTDFYLNRDTSNALRLFIPDELRDLKLKMQTCHDLDTFTVLMEQHNAMYKTGQATGKGESAEAISSLFQPASLSTHLLNGLTKLEIAIHKGIDEALDQFYPQQTSYSREEFKEALSYAIHTDISYGMSGTNMDGFKNPKLRNSTLQVGAIEIHVKEKLGVNSSTHDLRFSIPKPGEVATVTAVPKKASTPAKKSEEAQDYKPSSRSSYSSKALKWLFLQ